MEDNQTGKYEIVNLNSDIPYKLVFHKNILKHSNRISYEFEHWHKDIEITYIFCGPVDYIINGKRYHKEAGQIQLINSECIHSVETVYKEPDGKWDAFTLLIDYGFLIKNIPEMKDSFFEIKDQESETAIAEIMRNMAYYGDQNSSKYSRLKILSMVYDLIYILSEHCLRAKSVIPINNQKNVERIRNILIYIEEHYQENLREQDLVKKFYFSREYFCRFFKKYTTYTFKEYLTLYRVKKSEEMLEETDQSVIDIANNTGFSDTRQFINSFKKYYGKTPYKYKKNIH